MHRLEQQVVEAEGGIEGRIAIPGALGIEQHRVAVAPRDEDVLGADVAVHQRDPRRRRLGQHRENGPGQARLARRERPQIGIEPQRIEQIVRREGGSGGRIVEGRGMDAAQRLGNGARRRRIGTPGQEFGLPEQEVTGLKKFEERDTVLTILAEHLWRGTGDDLPGPAQPGDLIVVAFERRLPVALDLEFGQRPLGAERTTIGKLHAYDVGRNATGERHDFERSGECDSGGSEHWRQQSLPVFLSHHPSSRADRMVISSGKAALPKTQGSLPGYLRSAAKRLRGIDYASQWRKATSFQINPRTLG